MRACAVNTLLVPTAFPCWMRLPTPVTVCVQLCAALRTPLTKSIHSLRGILGDPSQDTNHGWVVVEEVGVLDDPVRDSVLPRADPQQNTLSHSQAEIRMESGGHGPEASRMLPFHQGSGSVLEWLELPVVVPLEDHRAVGVASLPVDDQTDPRQPGKIMEIVLVGPREVESAGVRDSFRPGHGQARLTLGFGHGCLLARRLRRGPFLGKPPDAASGAP